MMVLIVVLAIGTRLQPVGLFMKLHSPDLPEIQHAKFEY
jgi:hypothetical protein